MGAGIPVRAEAEIGRISDIEVPRSKGFSALRDPEDAGITEGVVLTPS